MKKGHFFLWVVSIFVSLFLFGSYLYGDSGYKSGLFYISAFTDYLPVELRAKNNPYNDIVYSAVTLSDGRIVLAGLQRVMELDKSGEYLYQIGKQGNDEGEYKLPWQVGRDANNDVFVLDQSGRKVIHYTESGIFKNEIEFDSPSVVRFVVTMSGNIFIPQVEKGSIAVYNGDGKKLKDISLSGATYVSIGNGYGDTVLLLIMKLSGTALSYYVMRYDDRGNYLDSIKWNVKAGSIYAPSIVETSGGDFYVVDMSRSFVLKVNKRGEPEWKKKELEIVGGKKKLNMPYFAYFSYSDNSLLISDTMNMRILKFKEYKNIKVLNSEEAYIEEANKYIDTDEDLTLCYINQGLMMFPNSFKLYRELGNFYHRRSFYKKAITAWKKALNLKPGNLELSRLIKRDEVLIYTSRADKLAEIVKALTKKYGFEYAKEQYREAIDNYKRAYDISGDISVKKKIERLVSTYSGGSKKLPRVTIETLKVKGSIFSAVYKYFNDHPIGHVRVKNTTGYTLDWLKADVNVKEFMDYPTESKTYKSIGEDAVVDLDLFAVFNNKIITVTEDTPISAVIRINYSIDNREYSVTKTVSFKLYNRNAMTWDNQKKLGSFITPRDPSVRIFSRRVIQDFRNARFSFLDSSLQSAMQIFDALGVYGITYIPDPKTPYEEFSGNPMLVDYIQYPRDTLRFKTGDCDDLTVLYCALLESIGIETATVTVPGHIFMVFNTNLPVTRWKKISVDKRNLFLYRGSVWIPVEITMMGESFLDAWREGADEIVQYRRNLGVALTEDSWREYAPVTLELEKWEPDVPKREYVERMYFDDVNNFIERELTKRVESVEKKIERDPKNPRYYNSLGVAYAMFGRYSDAELAFKKSIELLKRKKSSSLMANYYSPYVNLGNVYLKKKNYDDALAMYKNALRIAPKRASVYINLAFVYKAKGDFTGVRDAFNTALKLNKRIASEYEDYFTDIISGSSTGGRARRHDVESMVLWEE